MPRAKRDHVLVLGGGKGTRMGGAKVLMQVGGQSWWRLQMGRMKRAGIDQTWVVSPAAQRAIASEPDHPTHLVEAAPDEPMFSSVIRGIASLDLATIRGVFILPIDVPAPDPDVWEALSATGRCAVPVYQSTRGHPIFLPSEWVRTNLLSDLPLADQRLDILVRRDRTDVPVDDPDIMTNLNTPDDVQSWLDRQQT